MKNTILISVPYPEIARCIRKPGKIKPWDIVM
jgi:hypothetical protein